MALGAWASAKGQQSASILSIDHYALIGDCRTAALVSREGSIDWLCLPDFSSPSVFARLLDSDRGGSFSIQPQQPFTATRQYIANTAVLETTFHTTTGTARLVDLCPVVDGTKPMYPMRELLRCIEGRAGTVEISIRIDAQPDYARLDPSLQQRGRLGWAYIWGSEILIVRSEVPLQQVGSALEANVPLHEGERLYVSLSYVKGDPAVYPAIGAAADERIQQTIHWWEKWADRCRYTGPYRGEVIRSAITLKLLTYVLSGAIVAAPTTSLPEALGRDRNWDYRYCWLRDAGLTNQALTGLGYAEEARSFLGWLLHATRLTWPELQIVYDVFGRTRLQETELRHLRGYRESQPVRIGNGAHDQPQLDVYGEVVMAAAAVVAAGGSLDSAEARMLSGLGEVVCSQWDRPDNSIWEIRGPRRQYTFSKVMCWVALHQLLRLHDLGALCLGKLHGKFSEIRDLIARTIERRGYNPALASYTSELDGSHVDASLLLMACVGYKPANDPRMVSTYELIQQRLRCSGLLRRYEHLYDGNKSTEGAFGICSFWAVDNLAKRGEIDAAESSFKHLLSFANDVGLYAEEIATDSGAALGNFPQAFTHVGLINAALAIESARGES